MSRSSFVDWPDGLDWHCVNRAYVLPDGYRVDLVVQYGSDPED